MERLVSLLNSCQSGNLPPQDQQELGELVGENFATHHYHDDGWHQNNDSELEDEVPETDQYTDPTEEETDEPIASVDVAVGGSDTECDDMAVDNSIHTLLVKAQQRSCKASGHGCVQIRVAD